MLSQASLQTTYTHIFSRFLHTFPLKNTLTYIQTGLSPQALTEQWDPFSAAMQQRVKPLLPADAWTRLPPQLYLAFWSLALYGTCA